VGRGCATGAETGAARSGSTRARPEEEDDRRVPPVGETQEEGGGVGCAGELIPGRKVNWASRNELGCEVLGHAAEKASWAAGVSWLG
jgi:hypothetical protein